MIRRLAIIATLVLLARVAAAQGITPFPICTAPGDQLYPVVSGDFVAWMHYQDGNFQIQAMHVSDPAPTTITTMDSYQPTLGQGLLVWDARPQPSAGFQIYGYDTATHSTSLVCPEATSQTYPATDGNNVIWQTGAGAIEAYDRSSGALSVLSGSSEQTKPAVSGRYVVWEDDTYVFDPGDIRGYDLQTNQQFTVTDQTYAEIDPAISGNIVVWTDYRKLTAYDTDIYAKNLLTGDVFPICTAPGSQSTPAIDGNIVVWMDGRPDAPGIYGYDLSTGKEFLIALLGDALSMEFPKISGNFVVWSEETANGDLKAYGAYVPEPASAVVLLFGALVLRRKR